MITVEIVNTKCGVLNKNHPDILYTGENMEEARSTYDKALFDNKDAIVRILVGRNVYQMQAV